MQVIEQWTGREADALRRALRMTADEFAAHLRASPRAVAYWRERPSTVLQAAAQRALDSTLEAAPDRAKAQFALLVGGEHVVRDASTRFGLGPR
jgi:DNA-binding transcriptional regulator YiaG